MKVLLILNHPNFVNYTSIDYIEPNDEKGIRECVEITWINNNYINCILVDINKNKFRIFNGHKPKTFDLVDEFIKCIQLDLYNFLPSIN